ncbi:MAG: hypothetical protein LBQ22_05860 [Bacteroidales bacterium]|jgi:hypothetical protein|nr:hypothetical protein [Bacteroidales bacterium]
MKEQLKLMYTLVDTVIGGTMYELVKEMNGLFNSKEETTDMFLNGDKLLEKYSNEDNLENILKEIESNNNLTSEQVAKWKSIVEFVKKEMDRIGSRAIRKALEEQINNKD